METPWPDLDDENAFKVYWPKTLLGILIFGIFTVIVPIAMVALNWAGKEDKLPAGNTALIIIFIFLAIFWIGALFGLIKSIKIYGKPTLRLYANQNGIYLNILYGDKKAFFLPWKDVEELKVENLRPGQFHQKFPSLSIYFKENPNHNISEIKDAWNRSSNNNILMPESNFNLSLDEIINKLNALKNCRNI